VYSNKSPLGVTDARARRPGRTPHRAHCAHRPDRAPASGRSCRETAGVDAEDAACRLSEQKIDYIYDPSFDQPDTEAQLLGQMSVSPNGAFARPETLAGLSPQVFDPAGRRTLLRPEEEVCLFLRMNYLKYRAGKLRESPSRARPTALELPESRRLREGALALKNLIVRCNLRLVVHLVRRRAGAGRISSELVSEGNLALMHAVEKFDVSRGFKFSTYASRAIARSLHGASVQEFDRRGRFETVREELILTAQHRRCDESAREDASHGNREAVRRMLAVLSDRERGVIVSRFGLEGCREKTLGQLGEELGITRERVRQIESRAREKLREFATEHGLDSTAG
jgi:RNA polymerase primary sigma factor